MFTSDYGFLVLSTDETVLPPRRNHQHFPTGTIDKNPNLPVVAIQVNSINVPIPKYMCQECVRQDQSFDMNTHKAVAQYVPRMPF